MTDILATVRGLRARGVEFMSTPGSYFDMLPERLRTSGIGAVDESLDTLRELEILVDGDKARQYLLQIFLKEAAGLHHDPEAGPFFFEIIQRKGDQGFGAGNFRALFEAIERDQQSQRNRDAAGGAPAAEGARTAEDVMLDRMTAGTVPAKPHTALRDDAGRLRYEECLTRDGFDGPYTILYHQHRPHTQEVTPVEHGWRVPGARATAPRSPQSRPARWCAGTIDRRISRAMAAARPSTRACRCCSTRTSRCRSCTRRSPTRSTSPTATATISISSSVAAARCARRWAIWPFARATTSSCRAACPTASCSSPARSTG